MNGNTETLERPVRPISEVLKELADATPRLVGPFTPSNGAERKAAFLSGETDLPQHIYRTLATYDFETKRAILDGLKDQLGTHPEVTAKFRDAYEDAVGENTAKLRMLEIANQLHGEINQQERDVLRAEFMKLNIEVHGEPDREVYSSLVSETTEYVGQFTEGTAGAIANELAELLPKVVSSHERFKPEAETLEWIQTVAKTLYEPMIAHVDDSKDAYGPLDVKELFETIIKEEFGEVAAHWKVKLSSEATSIEVMRLNKEIVIPENRKPSNPHEMKGLVAHELGVHMLRTVMGEQADLAFMSTGLARYADIEEGLGMIMQQAVTGQFKDAGTGLYLAASLAYFENKDFGETFEILWRKTALEKLKPGEELDDAAITKARDSAYRVTQRIFRGTDELPWFKDLSYLSGTDTMLRHLESIRGDDLMLTFLLLGKANPTEPEQVRTMLETRTQ